MLILLETTMFIYINDDHITNLRFKKDLSKKVTYNQSING